MLSYKKNFGTTFTGWSFIVAAALLWGGWMLLSHHLGEYIKAEDFSKIGERMWYWIWVYRIHIFGWAVMAMALFSLVSISEKHAYHVLIVPGAGMTIVGTITLALGTAFYYGFGSQGVGATAGKSPEEIEAYMNSISSMNYYATCLFRFGKLFSGLGLVVIGFAFARWKMVSAWLSWYTILLGVAAMSIILFIPENFDIYKPVFHLKSLWLVAIGVYLVRKGIHIPKHLTKETD